MKYSSGGRGPTTWTKSRPTSCVTSANQGGLAGPSGPLVLDCRQPSPRPPSTTRRPRQTHVRLEELIAICLRLRAGRGHPSCTGKLYRKQVHVMNNEQVERSYPERSSDFA